jgi:hypothetical protein
MSLAGKLLMGAATAIAVVLWIGYEYGAIGPIRP